MVGLVWVAVVGHVGGRARSVWVAVVDLVWVAVVSLVWMTVDGFVWRICPSHSSPHSGCHCCPTLCHLYQLTFIVDAIECPQSVAV